MMQTTAAPVAVAFVFLVAFFALKSSGSLIVTVARTEFAFCRCESDQNRNVISIFVFELFR